MHHRRHSPHPWTILFLISALLSTGVGQAAVLLAEPGEVAPGEYVTAHVEQARVSAGVTWRTGPQLRLEDSHAGSARFQAIQPGRALISATVDGELVNAFVVVAEPIPGTLPPEAGAPVPSGATAPAADGQPRSTTLARAPHLRDRLPQDAFAYLRIPSLWGVLGTPKGNLFDEALGSAAYQQAVVGIQGGLVETLLPQLPPDLQVFWQLLLAHLRSPLELAMLPPGAPGATFPDVVATAALDLPGVHELNLLLAKIAENSPEIALMAPLGADGAGVLALGQMPIPVYYDPDGRLYFRFSDPGAPSRPLGDWVRALKANPGHAMGTAEQAIDQSGQGLFVWVNPAPMMQTLEKMGQAQEVAMWRALGASEARAVALGMGGSAGKQRIKLLVDMPLVGFRSFFPAISADLQLRTAGAPELAVMFGLPAAADLATVEGALRGLVPETDFAEYEQAKAQMREALGFGVEDVLAAFGSEVLGIYDRAGRYLAVRIRDADAYKRILQSLEERFQLKHERRELPSGLYHHLVLPAVQAESGELPPYLQRLEHTPSHLYWIEEDGYLLLATVPQTLMDYRAFPAKASLADWLRGSQGVDPSGAVLLATARTRDVPQMMYELHLLVLSVLGDLADRPVDLFTLPSPRALGLPESGAYSFQLTSSAQQLGLELVYESNPIELLLALGLTQSAITAGTLAAVAIPAYMGQVEAAGDVQDQAQGSGGEAGFEEVMDGIAGLQASLGEFHRQFGRFPAAGDLQPFLDELSGPGVTQAEMEPDTGRVLVEFAVSGLPGEHRLLLAPTPGPDGIHWVCDSDLPLEQFPENVCPR